MRTATSARVTAGRPGYAVAWRDAADNAATGRLEVNGDELVLRGADASGSICVERVPLDRIAAVRVGRTRAERIGGVRSVALELDGGETLSIAPIGAAGAVFELADLVAELRSRTTLRGDRVGIVLPLRPGSGARARQLVAEGPPFDLEQAHLDRHEVFVTDREAVFLFEGERARETVERLVRDPRVLREAARWQECLAGRPRLAEESFTWRRSR